MSRWWRAYDEAVDDPKLQRLSGEMFKAWFNLMCLASQNNGVLPCMADIAFKLRVKEEKALDIVDRLSFGGLIDRLEDDSLVPHNWNARQYKSDVSTERVQRFRNAQRNVSETPPETEADTDNRNRKKDSRAVAKATRPKTSSDFEEFWKAYPRRLGANPKAPAFKVFDAAVKQGTDPPAIIGGARRCAQDDADKIGTPFIPQAVKWLRDQRWNDYAAEAGTSVLSDDERKQMFEKLRGTGGVKATGTDLRDVGEGARPSDWHGRKEPTAVADDQTRHAGMGRLEAVFREPSGLRTDSDDAGPGGVEPGIYGAGQVARTV